MKGFLIRISFFLLPIVLVVVLYSWLDPFRVVGLYANYKPTDKALTVPLNQNRVSAGTFCLYNDHMHFNAFIFGSSRSMFYEIEDWQPYLGIDSRCFHFDASAETLEGILHKIEFLDKKQVPLKDVLLVLDADIFRPYTLLNEHLYMEDPLVVGMSNWLSFHSAHFMAFLDRKFLRAYADYELTGEAKPYMTQLSLLDDKPFAYDAWSNETRYEFYKSQAAIGEYYTSARMEKFNPARDGMQRFSSPVIDPVEERHLKTMASVFAKHQSRVRIVISPLYNQIRLSNQDVLVLRNLFGEDSVFDFSGINKLTQSHTGYYERSHYRPHIAKAVLDSVYGGAALNLRQ